MMNNFFDCLNVRVTNEAPLIENGRVNKKRNPFVEPFKTVDDFRFTWLTQDFLQYFENWLYTIESQPGNYTRDQKAKMFIARPT